MEERQNSGVTKVLLILILIFCMVISGMIGFGITGFNAINNPQIAIENSSENNTDEASDKGKEAGDKSPEKKETVKLPHTQTDTKLASERTADLSDVVEAVMPSLVAITTEGEESINSWFGKQIRKTKDMGSGIIIDKDEKSLFIITNNHVIEDTNSLEVEFTDGTKAAASIKGGDSDNDVAVVAIKLSDLSEDTLSKISIANIGDSDSVKVGQGVVAIGNALGYGQSVTVGYVSALNREIKTEGGTSRNLLQTDAAINPGNSGGALLNMKGEVIGINSAKYSDTAVEGMGYAIPITAVKELIGELSTKETRTVVAQENQGYLGIQGKDIDEEMAKAYDMPQGIYVYKVVEGGAAASSDLKAKDIIIKFDGQSVRSMESLKNMLTYYESGRTIDLTVQRLDENGDYVEKTISITLGKREIQEQ